MATMPQLKKQKTKRGSIRGERHYAWRGDRASNGAKRTRARALYVAEQCEICHATPAERHHVDSNPGNNEASNVQVLCRKCHMIVDGRLEALREVAKKNAVLHKKPPRPCENCGKKATIFRRGECPRCAEYRRRHAKARPRVESVKEFEKVFGECSYCSRVSQLNKLNECLHCYRARWMREFRAKEKLKSKP